MIHLQLVATTFKMLLLSTDILLLFSGHAILWQKLLATAELRITDQLYIYYLTYCTASSGCHKESFLSVVQHRTVSL